MAAFTNEVEMESGNLKYQNLEYWNSRYRSEDTYDWFKEYASFRHIIRDSVKTADRILMLGCGNSTLSEEMFLDGFSNIVNIDYSSVVIENMRNRSTASRSMEWITMDARQLHFPDSSFDVVLEKGTLDAMTVGEKDPWKLSTETGELLDKILCQTSRVLKDNGRFVSITFAQPHFRRPIYAKPEYGWSVEHLTFGDGFHYFAYVMTKGRHIPI